MRQAVTYSVLAGALLSGCGTANLLRVPESAPEQVTVRWVRVPRSQIRLWCAKANMRLGAQPLPTEAIACAVRDSDVCTIYTTPEVSEEIVGHEVGHCFMGAWHN